MRTSGVCSDEMILMEIKSVHFVRIGLRNYDGWTVTQKSLLESISATDSQVL